MTKLGMPAAAAAMAVVFLAPAVQAGEGGGSSYPGGVENFLTGAAPPPGFYVLEYGNVYRADKLKDGSGKDVPIPVFKVAANVAATRFAWSTTTSVAGGNLLLHAIVPVVDLKVEVPGLAQRKTGLGDITFGPALAFHHSPSLHSVVGVDLVAPVGRYAKGTRPTSAATIGRCSRWSPPARSTPPASTPTSSSPSTSTGATATPITGPATRCTSTTPRAGAWATAGCSARAAMPCAS